MMSNRYRASSRRCSILPTSARNRSTTKRRQQHNPPVMSNIQGMRGKMSKNCLCHACQALFVGLLLFSIGAAMSTLGFHADGVLDSSGNSTISRTYIYNDSRTTVRFSKLSHAGPIVMGIGGFIIVATCVLTFEARDSAAKVGPASYTGGRTAAALYSSAYRVRSRSLDVRSVASQTIGEGSSTSGTNIFDKKTLLETFKKFSRTIRTGSTSKEDTFHRSPSAPSLLATDGQCSSAPTTSRRAYAVPKASHSRARAPGMFKNLRQTMSVDYSCTSPFIVQAGCSSGNVSSHSSNVGHNVKSSLQNVSSSSGKFPNSPNNPNAAASGGSQQQLPLKSGSRGIYGRAMGSSTASADNQFASVSLNSDGGETPKQSQSNLSFTSSEVAVAAASVSKARRISLPMGQSHYPGFKANLNVHFTPTTVESHLLPYVVVTPNTAPSSSIEALTASSSSLRIISPLPSHRSEDSSFDRSSLRSESISCGMRSPLPGSRPRLRTELSCRPALIRQSGMDHSEIISVSDSEDEPILEEESEVDV